MHLSKKKQLLLFNLREISMKKWGQTFAKWPQNVVLAKRFFFFFYLETFIGWFIIILAARVFHLLSPKWAPCHRELIDPWEEDVNMVICRSFNGCKSCSWSCIKHKSHSQFCIWCSLPMLPSPPSKENLRTSGITTASPWCPCVIHKWSERPILQNWFDGDNTGKNGQWLENALGWRSRSRA